MQVSIKLSALKETKWYEYALRVIFGGLVTVATGVIAKRYGPGIGGLFLGFPAIFPATATLVEKHQKQKKQRAGLDGTARGRVATSLIARGAQTGAVGLILFALIVWRKLIGHAAWAVLLGAALAWFALSASVWRVRAIVRHKFIRWSRARQRKIKLEAVLRH